MKIVLNDQLVRVEPRFIENDPTKFAGSLAASLDEQPLSFDVPANTEAFQKGFIKIVANAYSCHEKLRIAPHDLWFIVLTELTKVIAADSDKFKSLFSTAAGKTTILVQTDDVTEIDPQAIIAKLRDLVPTNIDIFIPQLSTMGEAETIAFGAAFADLVSPYYNYMTFLCGIPEIDVTGTFEDWQKLVYSTSALASIFLELGHEKLVKYMIAVGDILSTIAGHVGGVEPSEPNFWKNIFTQKNVGSGSQLAISGWITKLFYTKHPVAKLENFTSTYSVISYKNLETNRSFKSMHGPFCQLRDEEGFLYAGYSKVVFEVPSE